VRSADGLLFDEKIPVQMPATGDATPWRCALRQSNGDPVVADFA